MNGALLEFFATAILVSIFTASIALGLITTIVIGVNTIMNNKC